jgi:hypothetical protein
MYSNGDGHVTGWIYTFILNYNSTKSIVWFWTNEMAKHSLFASVMRFHVPGLESKMCWFIIHKRDYLRYCRAYVAWLYKTGIGLTTGFIGSHTITVYTLYNSLLQLQLFSEDYCSARTLTRNWNCPRLSLVTNSTLSISEDSGSNCCNHCCNQLLWRPLPLFTNWLLTVPVTLNYIARERTTKKAPTKIPLLLHGLPIVACLSVA